MEKSETGVTYARTLDIDRDIFLHDHTMGDVPLFLGSTGVETMGEVATSLAGDKRHLVELTGFHIPYGIKLLKQRPKDLLITGETTEDGTYQCSITSVFKNPKGVVMGDPKLHYEGIYRFSEKPLKAKRIAVPEFSPVSWDGDLDKIVYHPQRLFMFGLFGTIKDINSFDGKTLITTVKDDSTKEFFKGVKDPRFVAAPVILDAMFQTGGLLEFLTTSRTVLPFGIKSLKFYKPVEKNTAYYCITSKVDSAEETNTYDLILCDEKGNVVVEVDTFDMVKLNRLDPEHQINGQVAFTNKYQTQESSVD